MSTPRTENRRYLLRLWIPVLAFCAIVGSLLVAALTSGEQDRVFPVVIALVLIALFLGSIVWYQTRRLTRALQSADPSAYLHSLAATNRRIPQGALFAATTSAIIFGLYGRFQEAEKALASVSWQDAPPLMQAQEHLARAVIAYTQGDIGGGLGSSISAAELASVDPQIPGAQTSDLALRTLRNLGLALAGRATASTEQELGTAFARLPLIGRIYAAWALAVIAGRKGDVPQLQAMRAFIAARAPHFTPVLQSIDSVSEGGATVREE